MYIYMFVCEVFVCSVPLGPRGVAADSPQAQIDLIRRGGAADSPQAQADLIRSSQTAASRDNANCPLSDRRGRQNTACAWSEYYTPHIRK